MTTANQFDSQTTPTSHGVDRGGIARHAMSGFASTASQPISRCRRTRILVDGNPELTTQLCQAIEAQANLTITSVPQEVLVMHQVRETAQNSLFYLGEALMTECKVTLTAKYSSDDKNVGYGLGMIMGSNRERAYELAVIDAAFDLSSPLPGQSQWMELLLIEEQQLATRQDLHCQQLDTTRVDFQEMLTEEDRLGGL